MPRFPAVSQSNDATVDICEVGSAELFISETNPAAVLSPCPAMNTLTLGFEVPRGSQNAPASPYPAGKWHILQSPPVDSVYWYVIMGPRCHSGVFQQGALVASEDRSEV